MAAVDRFVGRQVKADRDELGCPRAVCLHGIPEPQKMCGVPFKAGKKGRTTRHHPDVANHDKRQFAGPSKEFALVPKKARHVQERTGKRSTPFMHMLFGL